MKNRVFPIFLIIIITLFLYGCKGNVKSPGISFTSDIHDFGIIDEGKSAEHVFQFTNTGTTTLIVKEVRPTCGCTIADNFDKEVKPGQNGTISVSFNSSGFDGPVAKPIIVKTNVPDHSDFTLTLKGTVKVALSLNPKTLFLGDIERNRSTPLAGMIFISNRLAEPITITDVTLLTDAAQKPNLTFAGDNVETMLRTINAGFEYSLLVTVNPPFKYGQVIGTLLLKTDSERTPEIKTDFSYNMEPLVKVFPNPLFVSEDQIEKGKEVLINIECEPGPDMRIVDFSVNMAEVKVSLKEVERGSKYKLVLVFPKDFEFDPGNTLTATFKAQNIPDEPIFDIPVLGM